jgi:predicted hydrocarbon binding protein
MFKQQDYRFEWKDVGNIQEGRPTLGKSTDVAVYRLMHFSLRDILNHEVGIGRTNKLFFEAGKLAGSEFCKNVLDKDLSFNEFVADLLEKLKVLCVGILSIEEADLEKMDIVLTVAEDLDCSGLPPSGETICDYDEGFIAGILETYSGKQFEVKEIDCWTSGGRLCRFAANLKQS